jgi:hypothetical protein
VPGQIQRAFLNLVGTIIAFIQRNCFDNTFGNAMFISKSGEINSGKQENSLVGLHLRHGSV